MNVSTPILRPFLLTMALLLVGRVNYDLSAQVGSVITPVIFSVETPPISGLVSVAPNPGSDKFEIFAAEGVEFNGIKVYNSSGSPHHWTFLESPLD
ncbi:MAG: hypothetical protein AAF399_14515 [Bacteroidota bacterium]